MPFGSVWFANSGWYSYELFNLHRKFDVNIVCFSISEYDRSCLSALLTSHVIVIQRPKLSIVATASNSEQDHFLVFSSLPLLWIWRRHFKCLREIPPLNWAPVQNSKNSPQEAKKCYITVEQTLVNLPRCLGTWFHYLITASVASQLASRIGPKLGQLWM